MSNEIKSAELPIDCKYTFWKLLSNFKIEIPIIQRDYAQGRDTASAIRSELLDSIYEALTTDSFLDFDFVYGSTEEFDGEEENNAHRKLLPLDGQQRLTTFFLLHWYLAEKEDRMEEARAVLKNFSYTTRISSREFCKLLVELDYAPSKEEPVSLYIKNENRYFKIWDNDPTIKAMLVMLDSIHEKFFDCPSLFDKLISEEPAIITFSYLPMEHYALTDDLYIKMNARGKALSNFENFKAKFIQHLKKTNLPSEKFENSIDGQWVNLLWDYRARDNTIDKQFMNLFNFCTEMIFLLVEEPIECESPFRNSDIRTLVEYYDTEGKVNLLYALLDLWTCKEEAKTCLEGLLSQTNERDKVRLFDGQPDLFSDVVSGNNVSLTNRILLFSIMNRLITLGKDTNHEAMLDYVRIVRNFLIKARFFSSSKCAYSTDFRFGRNGIPYMAYFAVYLADSEDPYAAILCDYSEEFGSINSETYRQESVKANAIKNNPELKPLIQGLEDLDIFRGSIFNILDYVIEEGDITLIDTLDSLFTADNSDYIFPALISVSDYGIKVGGTYLGEKFFYGNRNHWYEVLTYAGGKTYTETLTKFVREYVNNDSEDIQDALSVIAEENLKSIEKDNWRYYLVKYPSSFEETSEITNPNLVFAFEKYATATILHRMNKERLSSPHVVPEYIEASKQLGDKCYSLIACYNNGYEGGISLICDAVGDITITLDNEGEPHITYTEDADEEAINKALDVFEKKVAEEDRVERLVLLSNILFQQFKK